MIATILMPDRQCNGCTRQAEWGCHAKLAFPSKVGRDAWSNPAMLPTVLDGEEVWSCPRQSLREDPEYWSDLFRYFSLWKRGYLPNGHDPEAQTQKAMTILQLTEGYVAECHQQKAEQERIKGNRAKGPPGKGRPQ